MNPLAVGPEAKVLPFRRRGAAVRVRRRSVWRRLAAPLAQATLVVALPLALATWLFASPSFALTEIEVLGARRVPARWVEQALTPLSGANLPRLPLAEVTARLLAHPWVAAVAVEKRLPHALVVRLAEREPAALWRRGSDLVFLDAAGRAIAPYDPALAAADLLLLSAARATARELEAALAFGRELALLAPDWAAGLSEIELLGDEDYRLFSAALPFPMLVRRSELGARFAELRRLLPQLAERYPAGVESVDLRFPRRIVFVPAPPTAATSRSRERPEAWQSQSST